MVSSKAFVASSAVNARIANGSVSAKGTMVIEQWRKEYNLQCPHIALRYQTPAQLTALSTQQPGATFV
jgi:hypothetical protein